MSTNVETVGPLAKELSLYLFKFTSFCTDARTEEAYLRKSYRAEFKLGLPKLTFNSPKIALLSASLQQDHPQFGVISQTIVRKTHAC